MDELIIKEYNFFENIINTKIKSIIPKTCCSYCYLIKENSFNKIYNLINFKKKPNR